MKNMLALLPLLGACKNLNLPVDSGDFRPSELEGVSRQAVLELFDPSSPCLDEDALPDSSCVTEHDRLVGELRALILDELEANPFTVAVYPSDIGEVFALYLYVAVDGRDARRYVSWSALAAVNDFGVWTDSLDERGSIFSEDYSYCRFRILPEGYESIRGYCYSADSGGEPVLASTYGASIGPVDMTCENDGAADQNSLVSFHGDAFYVVNHDDERCGEPTPYTPSNLHHGGAVFLGSSSTLDASAFEAARSLQLSGWRSLEDLPNEQFNVGFYE